MGEAEVKDNEVYEEDLVDYEEEVENGADGGAAAANASADVVKKGYVGIHSSGFRDFLLKPELLRAIQDCGAFVKIRDYIQTFIQKHYKTKYR
uniref:Uncharacterized protein n=1 Tax=Oryza glumipatula TaxID=40148 RepID=A0A0D9YAC6_9ORYZ